MEKTKYHRLIFVPRPGIKKIDIEICLEDIDRFIEMIKEFKNMIIKDKYISSDI